MPMIFSPTIGAAITARYWFLWVRCPACRTINAIHTNSAMSVAHQHRGRNAD
jgi:phage FluMu protein Com